jgi:3D (Asp-Asp-Asp) domain-containing protein
MKSFYTRTILMRKSTMVSTGIIMVLLGSNIVTGMNYVIDSNHYEKEILYRTKVNKYSETKNEKLEQVIKQKESDIDNLNKSIQEQSSEIHTLQQQLENANKRNELPSVDFNGDYYEISAYTAGYESTQKQKGDKGYGITASGTYVEEGVTIACPPSLEFGTKLNIEGIGLRVCEDRGAAIKTGHLDLYMDSLSEAIEFGRKTLMVEILS